jgi:hypothetical protein
MLWFTQSTSEGLAKATNNGSRVPASTKADNLAVFGLLPIGPSPRFSSLFCRDVVIEPRGHEGPWESIHLLLM